MREASARHVPQTSIKERHGMLCRATFRRNVRAQCNSVIRPYAPRYCLLASAQQSATLFIPPRHSLFEMLSDMEAMVKHEVTREMNGTLLMLRQLQAHDACRAFRYRNVQPRAATVVRVVTALRDVV